MRGRVWGWGAFTVPQPQTARKTVAYFPGTESLGVGPVKPLEFSTYIAGVVGGSVSTEKWFEVNFPQIMNILLIPGSAGFDPNRKKPFQVRSH